MTADRFDHLVIGSGINGLVAAAMLAKSGARVLVIEREDRIGGCLYTSDDVTLPGFHHDVMAATFVLFMTGPAQQALGDDLAAHGMAYCNGTHPTAVLRPDGSALVLTTDRSANVAAFNARADGDGDQHARDVGGIEQDAEFLFALLGQSLWSRRIAWLLARRAWKVGLGPLKAWFGRALQPARGWLETSYDSADVQALWAPWVLHVGLTPEATYSGQMGRVIAFALEAAGAPVVKGGAGQAAEALRKVIESHGGEVRTGIEARHAIIDTGRCVGVETTNKHVLHATNVIASTSPAQLYDGLLSPQKDEPDVKSYRYGRGNFQLHFALDGPIDWTAEGLEDVALIHLADGIDSVSKSANEAERGMLPERPTICVGQPHRLDPTRCPEGKAILWLQIPDAPRTIKGDAAGSIDTTPEWTETVREAFADRVEAILSQHIRNWRKIRLKRRAYSPADLARMNVNLVGGDPYGGACTLDQFFVWRPHAGQSNYSTGVKNLYHIGASTHPGPGLGGGSGFNVAKELGA
ncbi:NAD(P)/FAD-dependent oxidoreductase [Tateyamaria omphalii]|uniref:phytoene desaturase family protein n=1 Tax=Tateyamaria omphalii TaxID=299262 RepID=UPI001C99A388|nr:NAD(P)/FAD-dependent oxidoreductase [Tateyamaria omphalii]MBY5932716.1 NAD(P)/FAD-dependent oxidoreductase [Tateyamaria omphalii]